MKGIHALILAIGLGFAGALFNYAYLASRASQMHMVGFVGVKADVAEGEMLLEEHVVRVDIPLAYVGNLKDFAVPYDSVKSYLDMPVDRSIPARSLLLARDTDTPFKELRLGPNEAITWIPVDTRSMVPSLVNPGDRVSFLISTSRVGLPTPAEGSDPGGPEALPEPSGPIEPIGPFTVLSVGNRLASRDVFKSARIPQVQEHVIGIRVELDAAGNPMPHVQKLIELLEATGNRPAGIMLHGRSPG